MTDRADAALTGVHLVVLLGGKAELGAQFVAPDPRLLLLEVPLSVAPTLGAHLVRILSSPPRLRRGAQLLLLEEEPDLVCDGEGVAGGVGDGAGDLLEPGHTLLERQLALSERWLLHLLLPP